MPSESAIRRTLIPKLARRADGTVAQMVSASRYITITTDGWSNLRNESVVNYVVINESRNSVLLNATKFRTAHTKDSLVEDFDTSVTDCLHAVAVQRKIPPDTISRRIAAVVTDKASNVLAMRSALSSVRL